MAELRDIRSVLNPTDINYARRNADSLSPNQILDVTVKYGGGGGQGTVAGKLLKVGAVAAITCAVIFLSAYAVDRYRKNKTNI